MVASREKRVRRRVGDNVLPGHACDAAPRGGRLVSFNNVVKVRQDGYVGIVSGRIPGGMAGYNLLWGFTGRNVRRAM